jgi:hypothetical protein
MLAFRKTGHFYRGQSIMELIAVVPILLLLALGAIELSNIIYALNVLAHLTREGANLTSRGTAADEALDATIKSSGPLIVPGPGGNENKWRVIYVKIGPNPGGPEPPYVVLGQVVRGSTDVEDGRRICPGCKLDPPIFECTKGCPSPNIPNISTIAPKQTFHAVEAFYDYSRLTPLQNFVGGILPTKLYERAIFTEVQPAPPLTAPPTPTPPTTPPKQTPPTNERKKTPT